MPPKRARKADGAGRQAKKRKGNAEEDTIQPSNIGQPDQSAAEDAKHDATIPKVSSLNDAARLSDEFLGARTKTSSDRKSREHQGSIDQSANTEQADQTPATSGTYGESSAGKLDVSDAVPLNGESHDRLEDREHGEVTAQEEFKAEMSNPDRYFNRHPLSPLRDDDKQRWAGWRELETDPEAFNAMLRVLGVRGVEVQDVYGTEAASMPETLAGVLFCFKHHAEDETTQVESCPNDIWFANQTHRWLCGSNSLLNILLNLEDAQLGEHLEAFLDFTKNMTPAQRGEAVGNYKFLRQVHNSGLRKMEMLISDCALMEEYQARKKTKTTFSTTAKSKAKGKANGKAKQSVTTEADGIDENAAHHYTAYLPIAGNIWKLDGLDRQPSKLGPYKAGEWQQTIAKILERRVEEVEGDCNILGICTEEMERDNPLGNRNREEATRKSQYDYEPLVRTWMQMLADKEGVVRGIIESLQSAKST